MELQMHDTDDFRFAAHQLLVALDAATAAILHLVVIRQTSGDTWLAATSRQALAYNAWHSFLEPELPVAVG
jgi:hypothetical protein